MTLNAGETPGLLAAGGTAFCWSMTALFFGAASRRIGQYFVNQVRLVQACLFLTLACAVAGVFAFDAPAPQLAFLAVSGLVGLTLGDAAGFTALQVLGARRASLLGSTAPGFAALMMVPLLGESLDWIGMAGRVITLGGVMGVVLERAQPGEIRGRVWVGVVMGLLGALGQAGGLILSKVGLGAADDSWLAGAGGVQAGSTVALSPLFGTLVRMLAGTVALYAWAIPTRTLALFSPEARDRKALVQTTAGAFFGPFVGVSLSLAAVTWANTAVAATVMATSPVLVIPVVRLVYKHPITWRALAGALVAVAGVGVLALRERIAGLL
ncbi:MAG: DMT family transporter [Planctomycetes bacterium]|nr:DMT family transporter [Planctomycetota bacterium]